MPRLSSAELRLVRAFNDDVSTVRLGTGPVLATCIAGVRELLEAEVGVAYSGSATSAGCQLDFLHADGLSQLRLDIVRREAERWLEHCPGRWALFNPVRPETFQRNRAMAIGSFEMLASGGPSGMLDPSRLPGDEVRRQAIEAVRRAAAVFDGPGLRHHQQLRALLCEGPSLLAWVGVFQPEPYRIQQQLRLSAILPTLRERMRLERRLAHAELNEAIMLAALENIPGAALLVLGERVEGANSAGRSLLEVDRRLRQAEDSDGRFRRVKLSARGWPNAELWIEHDPASRLTIAGAAQRFRLTPRETQVLELLAQGHTNHAISAQLGCSLRTAEVHVSRILDKADCPSRAALIAELAFPRRCASG